MTYELITNPDWSYILLPSITVTLQDETRTFYGKITIKLV